jgi:hypothetical protein
MTTPHFRNGNTLDPIDRHQADGRTISMRAASILVVGIAMLMATPRTFAQITPSAKEALLSLGAPSTLKANFRQVKRLSGVDRPIAASGRMVYSAELGVTWSILSPIRHTTVLPLGAPAGGANRALGESAAIVGSIVGGKPDNLGRHFELSAVRDKAGWDLRLRPLSQGLGAVFDEIMVRIEQGAAIRVELREARGDSVTIHIDSPVKGQPLTADEVAAFIPRSSGR